MTKRDFDALDTIDFAIVAAMLAETDP